MNISYFIYRKPRRDIITIQNEEGLGREVKEDDRNKLGKKAKAVTKMKYHQ